METIALVEKTVENSLECQSNQDNIKLLIACKIVEIEQAINNLSKSLDKF